MNDVQRHELEVFKEVVKVLERHSLTYYAIGGTCLGAIRHGGFIPWDDDIDIALPREDYEKFRTEYYNELPEYLEKLDGDNAKHYPWMFMKIHDNRTAYISDYAKNLPDIYTGAFIDIMPMDKLPEKKDDVGIFLKRLNRCLDLNTIIRSNYKRIDSPSRLLKEIFRFIIKLTHKSNYYYSKFQRLVEEENKKVDSQKLFYSFFVYTHLPIEKISFPNLYFEELIDVPFEDTNIKVPKKYDDYLRTYFGDYMKLPPEKQRNSGHSAIVCDMNKPLSSYRIM